MKKFIEILKEKNIDYKIVKKSIIITGNKHGYVDLDSLTTIPEGIQFNKRCSVSLKSLISLTKDIQFNNDGFVDLSSLESIPKGFKFNNYGIVHIPPTTDIKGIQFNKKWDNSCESFFIELIKAHKKSI